VILAGLFLIAAVITYWYVVLPAVALLVTLYLLIQRDSNRVG
jgi:hypothetical protein